MLDSLHIKNFRCFEDLTIPSLGRVNLIVGKNNTGKSTLLEAITVFSQHGKKSALLNILNERDEVHGKRSELDNVYFNRNPSDKEIFIGNEGETLGFFLSEKKHKVLDEKLNLPYKFPQALKNKIDNHNYPFSNINTCIKSDVDMAEIWDDIRINKQNELASETLRLLDSNVEDVFYTSSMITMVSLAKESKALPIRSMGEGMSRLLQIFLHAFQARGGYLMIDEFENGLHYSIQEKVWEKLFKLAKELDIQVFATTHSQDTVRSFGKVAVADKEIDGKLISLGRSARSSNRGQIFPIVYEEDKLQTFIEMGMEVRG